MSQDLIKAKADYEEKIKDYTPAGKAAAKETWNRNLDKVKTTLVAKVNGLNKVKVLDKAVNDKLQASLAAMTASSSLITSSVVKPVIKMLSSYGSKQIATLKNTVAGIGSTSDSHKNSSKVVANRNAYLDRNQDKDIENAQSDIKTIDGLKF